jgi:hypothetical protein
MRTILHVSEQSTNHETNTRTQTRRHTHPNTREMVRNIEMQDLTLAIFLFASKKRRAENRQPLPLTTF